MTQQYNSHLSNALDAVSGDLGMFADYAKQKEMLREEQQYQSQREAAQRAFTAALDRAHMQQQQSQFETKEANDKSYQQGMLESRNKEIDATSSYRDAALKESANYHREQIGLEGEKVKASKQGQIDNRTANTLGSQLGAIGRQLQFYQKEKESRLNALASDPMFLGKSDSEQQAIRQKIEANYDQMISSKQREYDAKNKRYSDLTGVEYEDPSPDMSTGTDPSTSAFPATDPSAMPGMAPAPQVAPVGGYPSPPPGAIQMLKSNPSLKAAFDSKYGPGSSDRVLGGG